jgi:hypothetical protein
MVKEIEKGSWEVLQMRNCTKVRDSSSDAEKIRAALTEKLWLEKETGPIY